VAWGACRQHTLSEKDYLKIGEKARFAAHADVLRNRDRYTGVHLVLGVLHKMRQEKRGGGDGRLLSRDP
jgi:hypothetical protein